MKSTETRPPQGTGLIQSLKLGSGFFRFFQGGKGFFYLPVINAEKFVRTGSHVDVVRLALCPFPVHKSVNSVIRRRALDETVHDLEEGLSQVWGTLL